MIEKEDLSILKALMETVLDERLAETEERILEEVDKRLAETEERILKEVDKRLDKRLAETEERILKEVDKRLAETEERILREVDERIVKPESLLFSEMARVYETLDHKIEILSSKVEEVSQYYRTFRLDQDNMTVILSLIDALTRRVEILESKTA